LVAEVPVEVGERFIEKQHIGFDRKGTCEGHTLLLSAGERSGLPILFLRRESDPVEQVLNPSISLRDWHPAYFQPERDVPPGIQVREQSVVLKDHSCIPGLGRQD
jgi:hypothetical protein